MPPPKPWPSARNHFSQFSFNMYGVPPPRPNFNVGFGVGRDGRNKSSPKAIRLIDAQCVPTTLRLGAGGGKQSLTPGTLSCLCSCVRKSRLNDTAYRLMCVIASVFLLQECVLKRFKFDSSSCIASCVICPSHG